MELTRVDLRRSATTLPTTKASEQVGLQPPDSHTFDKSTMRLSSMREKGERSFSLLPLPLIGWFSPLFRMASTLSSSSATCCLTIRSAATPDSADPRQTKVVLPRKKPEKWSTGVAPGDYGGPPTTSKLRKYWGGGGDEDPVTATDDFIWNKDFVPRMQRLIRQEEATAPVPFLKESDSGFLSINRAMSLDSMEIDLSKELAPPPKPVLEQQMEAARRGRSVAFESLSSAPSPKWRLAPTRREQAKWDRASRVATGGTDVILRESKRAPGDPKVLAEQARAQYFKLKKKLQLLTLGIGGVGVLSAYVSYSSEIALSYGAGLVGSLMYIRMLGNSVDSLADGAKGLVKGAAAQPRLLVPLALVMIFNRWNGILVPEYGFMHLDLIPMLVGFFTYKIATFAQAIEESLFVVDGEANTQK